MSIENQSQEWGYLEYGVVYCPRAHYSEGVRHITVSPKVGERFTKFYILGLSAEATDYPKEVAVGAAAKVIVSIINGEHEVATYRVEVMINGAKNNEVGLVML